MIKKKIAVVCNYELHPERGSDIDYCCDLDKKGKI